MKKFPKGVPLAVLLLTQWGCKFDRGNQSLEELRKIHSAQKTGQSSPEKERQLFKAITDSDGARVQDLVRQGVEVDIRDDQNRTPLHIAAIYPNPKILEFLLDAGAPLEARDKYQNTPLHGAAFWGHEDNVELLLNRGADPNVLNNDGNTPFHRAAALGEKNVLELFANQTNIKWNAQNDLGFTVLHFVALHKRKRDVLKLLLEQPSIDLSLRDYKNRTALDIANEWGNTEIAQILQDHKKPTPK